jgi:hypothetical protein
VPSRKVLRGRSDGICLQRGSTPSLTPLEARQNPRSTRRSPRKSSCRQSPAVAGAWRTDSGYAIMAGWEYETTAATTSNAARVVASFFAAAGSRLRRKRRLPALRAAYSSSPGFCRRPAGRGSQTGPCPTRPGDWPVYRPQRAGERPRTGAARRRKRAANPDNGSTGSARAVAVNPFRPASAFDRPSQPVDPDAGRSEPIHS